MNKEQFMELARLLPKDASFFDIRMPGDQDDLRITDQSLRERACLMEPRLGWIFCQSFAKRGLQLPESICDPDFVRAHECIIKGTLHPHIFMASIVSRNLHPIGRGFICLQLLCPEIDFEVIAERSQMDLPTIQAFHTLFFNVRDRLADDAYIRHCLMLGCSNMVQELDYRGEVDWAIRQHYMRGLGVSQEVITMAKEGLDQYEDALRDPGSKVIVE